ncbi:MAG: 2-phospho-L-lactate transferase [Chloroflexia bacterium]|jgi:LPPG:FO 2-phospho-L-lactate transferase|nr:2-phospho-L-lactate transferase [Chloroflexia bacterium]
MTYQHLTTGEHASASYAPAPRVVGIAGGVGGAKLAHGLQTILPPGALSVVVNTADDFKLWSLYISPDLDTVMYTLAGLANRVQGWGLEDETWHASDMLRRYGQDVWFRLGDLDIATHVLRTHLLQQGSTISQVTAELAHSLEVPSHILPMCNEQISTMVQTPDGLLDFQEYFVHRHHSDRVLGVSFRTQGTPRITNEVSRALHKATAIVFCPSNPIVSIGPILRVSGIKEAISASGAPKVAVSPIVGGTALKGPAADMLKTLGHEVSPVGVARQYQGIIDGMVIDREDEHLAPRIRELGMEVEVTNTIMKSDDDRALLASSVLVFCNRLTQQRRNES